MLTPIPPSGPFRSHNVHFNEPIASRLVRGLLVGACILPIAVAAASDSSCSTTDASQCAVDPSGSVGAGLFLLVPVLLWVVPILGCLVGVVVGISGLLQASSPLEAAGWIFFSTLSLIVWIVLRRGQIRRREGSWTQRQLGIGRTGSPRPRGALAALALVVVAVWMTLTYLTLDAGNSRHEARAVVQRATIVSTRSDDDGDDLVVVRTDSGLVHQFSVTDKGIYHVGTETDVLIDPRDRAWAELVVEPHDVTDWLIVGTFCFGLAVLTLAWSRGWRGN